jgi:hypothetical protein
VLSLPAAGALRRRPTSADLEPGSYVTDGRDLFYVISQFNPGGGRVFASLEDCRTFDAKAYSPDELYRMGLKPVRTAAS